MKKPVDDFVRLVQESKNESLHPQKPGSEKPKHLRHLLKKLKNRVSKNDFRFLKTIKLEQDMPVHTETPRDLRYAPTGKPW